MALAAGMENSMLGNRVVGSVSGEPSDFHRLLATCVLVSLDCHSTFLGLTCLGYIDSGASFCVSSLMVMTE